MKKVQQYRILLIVLLLPLLFINVKDSHDWGDDFAQYIIQARNIVEFRPQTENGLLLNADGPEYAVKAYPVGFPLLIAPTFFLFGLAIKPFLLVIGLFLIAAGLLCFDYYYKRTGNLAAMLIALLFCFNPQVLELKKQILSEIPFTVSILLLLVWCDSDLYRNKYSWIITSLILVLIVSLRLAGIGIAAAYFGFEFFLYLKNKNERTKILLHGSIVLMAATTLFAFANEILFPVHLNSLFSFYSHSFQSYQLQLMNNINHYYLLASNFFPFFGWQVHAAWIIVAIIGWLVHFLKKTTLPELIFPIYALTILFYPYANAGTRFIIPLLPFLIYYTGYAFGLIFNRRERKIGTLSLVVFLSALLAYVPTVARTINTQSVIEDGPQKEESIELFNFLKSTPVDAVVVFCRARAIYLYTERSSLYFNHYESIDDAHEHFRQHKLLYIAVPKNNKENTIYDEKLSELVLKYKDSYKLAWANKYFDVYLQK